MTTYYHVVTKSYEVVHCGAGPRDVPTMVLLHGFPSSSHTFRELIADRIREFLGRGAGKMVSR